MVHPVHVGDEEEDACADAGADNAIWRAEAEMMRRNRMEILRSEIDDMVVCYDGYPVGIVAYSPRCARYFGGMGPLGPDPVHGTGVLKACAYPHAGNVSGRVWARRHFLLHIQAFFLQCTCFFEVNEGSYVVLSLRI